MMTQFEVETAQALLIYLTSGWISTSALRDQKNQHYALEI